MHRSKPLSFPGDAVPIEVRKHLSSLIPQLRQQGVSIQEIQARINAEYPCLGITVNTKYGFTIEPEV